MRSAQEKKLLKVLGAKTGDRVVDALVDSGVAFAGAVAWYFGLYQYHVHHVYLGIAHLPRKPDTIASDIIIMALMVCVGLVSAFKGLLLSRRRTL